MNPTRWMHVLAAALVFAAGVAAPEARACTTRQLITLQPGWNAIHIGLDPDEKDLATVFEGIEVASVWRYRPGQGGVQFVRDPADGLENLDGWFGWFPAARPEAFLSNLFRLEPNTSYLVKLEGTQSRTLTITGEAQYAGPHWQADAYTLTGLPITPANAPSFGEYFGPSDAHRAQPAYTLGADGRWRLVAAATEPVAANRAYWIYTRGNSDYRGPLRVVLEQGESIDFGAGIDRTRIVLRNLTGANGSFTIRREGGDTLPLAYAQEDTATRATSYPTLGAQLVLPATAGDDVFLTLAPKRREFTAPHHEQTFTVTDEQGSCVLLRASADAAQPGVAPGGGGAGVAPQAGLWAGIVTIDAVSEAQPRGAPPATVPTPTQRTFSLRVLMHVDADGDVRLLKDVIQMFKDGTTRPSAADPLLQEVDTPGRFVLVTDKTRLGLYSGATIRGSAEVGRRFSTVGYDFDGEALALAGPFGVPGTPLLADLVLTPQMPTNPFLHRYHPDHDNLDEQGTVAIEEAYRVRRQQTWTFAPLPGGSDTAPEFGSTMVRGTFAETVEGLHRVPIHASGTFELRRVSSIATLNE